MFFQLKQGEKLISDFQEERILWHIQVTDAKTYSDTR